MRVGLVMRVLMMGGTQFVGRFFTEELLNKGHEVTHFNRGKTNPGLFEGVETIVGDRNESLDAIAAREWDVVVDVNSYYLHQTERLNAALKDSVQHFVYVSTISVYDQGDTQRLPEDGPLKPMPEGVAADAELTNETYGPYKVLCEEAVLARWGDKATILRPGVIIGPNDHTDRFAFWPLRVSEGGEMAIPGDQDHAAITGLDVRDFAEFMGLCIDRKLTGIYNVDKFNSTFGDLRAAMRAFAVENGFDVTEVEIPVDQMADMGAYRWTHLPSLLPPDASLGDVTKAVGVGLMERPLIDSMRDTWDWMKQTGRTRPMKGGMDVEQEKEIIEKWRAQSV
ncbi:MAG: NAD-dependent epimerase/dehydratase family protein [Fimbriimonadaceae bacterium]